MSGHEDILEAQSDKGEEQKIPMTQFLESGVD